MSKWESIQLDDIVSIKGGYSYKGKFIGYGDAYLLGMGCVSFKEKFLESGARLYGGTYPESHLVEPNDIVLATRQQSDNLPILGMPALIPKQFANSKVIVGTNLYRVTNESDVDNNFLYWVLKNPDYYKHILSCAKGSTVRMITKDAVETYKFKLPSKKERQRIQDTLWSIENKIDLLRRQNETLEAMAETLFRQWFVEEAKEDWEETSLYDCIELIGGGTPKTKISEYWNGTIKWLAGGDIASNHKSIILDAEKSITSEGLDNSSAKLLPKYSTVISARGTVGKYCILSEPMAFSQSNYGVKPKYEDCYFFTYLLIDSSVRLLKSAAYGSVFDTITTNTFKGLDIKIPTEVEIMNFENSVKPYFNKIYNNQNQIKTLENLRDTLLPKLMSGEVRVKMSESQIYTD